MPEPFAEVQKRQSLLARTRYAASGAIRKQNPLFIRINRAIDRALGMFRCVYGRSCIGSLE